MNKKKNGFIATSLIYSFFLIFIALLALLIRTYIYNNTIVNRYNESVMSELNSNKYSIKMYLKNSEAVGGLFLNNLISNSGFELNNNNKLNEWNFGDNYKSSIPIYNIGDYLSSSVNESFTMTQGSINLIENNSYFIELDARIFSSNKPFGTSLGTPVNVGIKVYYDNTLISNYSISLNKYTENFIPLAEKFTAPYTSTDNTKYKIAITMPNLPSDSFIQFKNLRLLDLSKQYGKGNEPSAEWAQKNIEWFPLSANYFIKKNIFYGRTITVTFNTQNTNLTEVVCMLPDGTKMTHTLIPGDNASMKWDIEVKGDLICQDY